MEDALKKLLEALGIPQEKAVAALKELAIKHPDEAERAQAIEDLIREYATPALDPAALKATVAGIAADISSGQTGFDPDAWAGSG